MSGDIRGLEEPVTIPSSGQPKGPKSVETRDLHGAGSCGQNAVNLSKGAASEAWDIGEIGVVGACLRRIRQRDGGGKIPVKVWQVGKVGASRAL